VPAFLKLYRSGSFDSIILAAQNESSFPEPQVQ
jgi:hypothetical protein